MTLKTFFLFIFTVLSIVLFFFLKKKKKNHCDLLHRGSRVLTMTLFFVAATSFAALVTQIEATLFPNCAVSEMECASFCVPPQIPAANRARSLLLARSPKSVLFFQDRKSSTPTIYEAALAAGSYSVTAFDDQDLFDGELASATHYDIIIATLISTTENPNYASNLAQRIADNPNVIVIISEWARTNGPHLSQSGFSSTISVDNDEGGGLSAQLIGVAGGLLDGISFSMFNDNWGVFVTDTLGGTTLARSAAGTPIVAQSADGRVFFNGFSTDAVDPSSRKRGPNFDAAVEVVTRELAFLVGTGNADPHFAGANGVKFVFDGQSNGVYNVFSATQFQVNMLLAADGPKARFMTKFGVVFRNVTMHFGVSRYRQAYLDLLSKQLARFDAQVKYNGWQVTLDLCPGHTIVISQMHVNSKQRPWLAHDDGSVFYYLDIEVRVPHCSDAFGGVLGQTYQCKLVDQKDKFEFDHATEESFRVKSLDSLHDLFDAHAPCDAHPSGALPMIGGHSH
jgi:hypothetical protein